jgi:hypothetical protein
MENYSGKHMTLSFAIGPGKSWVEALDPPDYFLAPKSKSTLASA